MSSGNAKRVGNIYNAYGSLFVKEVDGRFWWSIECMIGDTWEEIPKSLYDELINMKASEE